MNVSCPWYLPWASSGESPSPTQTSLPPCPDGWGRGGVGSGCVLLLSIAQPTWEGLQASKRRGGGVCLSFLGWGEGIRCNLGLRPVLAGEAAGVEGLS